AGLIGALGLDRPLVCGYSDGGQIALELGMRYSHLVRALVVGAAGYDFASAHTQATLRRIGLPAPGEADFERVGQTLGRLVDLSATHAAVYGPDWWKTLLLQLSVLWHTPPGYAPEDFARIQVPTLILMGDRDGWVSIDEAVAMYRMIPGAELAIVPDAGHAFPWMRPEAFTGVVLEFLLRHAASGTAR
ncbi:MAG: alpha/beta hydrolase, partial [Armatimonadetes bacterium]|nr:alpha/beta hydrolase [Armatimonadota bacterium]